MVEYPEVDNYFQEFEGMTADQNRAPELSPTVTAMIEHEHVQIPTQKPCTKTTTLGKNLGSVCSSLGTIDKTTVQANINELQLDHGHDGRHELQDGRELCPRDISRIVREAIAEAQRIADREVESSIPNGTEKSLGLIMDEDGEELIATTVEKVVIRPAMDSGAVANVLHPKDLPADAEPRPNTTGKHFVGANNARIEKYGSCETLLESDLGAVSCNWQLADVARPLHSVSVVTGPADGPGKQDVLFNNRCGFVVPPGIVDEIMKQVRPIMKYPRDGNLYTCEVEMSAFRRQGQDA